MELILIRGLPGSGKTTKATSMIVPFGTRTVLLEADMFFLNFDGDYEYDPSKAVDAHIWCQSNTKFYMFKGYDVIVANTFTTLKDIAPYLAIAEDYGAKVSIHECTGDYGSIHNVPDEVMEAMRKRWVKTKDLFK